MDDITGSLLFITVQLERCAVVKQVKENPLKTSQTTDVTTTHMHQVCRMYT
jgi:hypothetical protein